MPANPHQILRSRVAIFQKNGFYGLIALTVTASNNVVGSFDSRLRPSSYMRSFETPKAAESAFDSHLSESRKNGWVSIYNGARCAG